MPDVMVHTIRGLIERSRLRPVDVVTESAVARTIATEWYLGEELVRRDVAVSALRPVEMAAKAAA